MKTPFKKLRAVRNNHIKASMVILALSVAITTKTSQAITWEKVDTKQVKHIQAISVHRMGILFGENANPAPNTFNGIFISKDFGESWSQQGLPGSAITGLFYYKPKQTLYATTYNVVNQKVGAYEYDNSTQNWVHLNKNFSARSFSRDSNTLYLGGIDHGLWISDNGGISWEQKIGAQGYGPEIRTIFTYASPISSAQQTPLEITFASTKDKTYKSTDHGKTWLEVTPLNGKSIYSFTQVESILLAGSNAGEGLFVSGDGGLTWTKNTQFSLEYTNTAINKLHYSPFTKGVYIASSNANTNNSTILESIDKGHTWKNIGPNMPVQYKAIDITSIYSATPFLLAAFSGGEGLYKALVEQTSTKQDPFLKAPWRLLKQTDLTESISAYFDHEYPLLGYYYFTEPKNAANTTVDYMDFRTIAPYTYYSSHNGIDFALPINTPVLAPASGKASYFFCTDCGNSIRIDHQNGYQSTFMHLQRESLITKAYAPITVSQGDVIGLIGMTGKTTGPHIHMEITRDTNGNGAYTDETPQGKVDPFGWESVDRVDPWENLTWNDTLGTHTGSRSINLWIEPAKIVNTIFPYYTSVTVDNKKVELAKTSFDTGVLIRMSNKYQPVMASLLPNKSYIPNTNFQITAVYPDGTKAYELIDPATIITTIENASLVNIKKQSLKIYAFNEPLDTYEELETTFDSNTNVISATTAHFSNFAVFGEKIDSTKPYTTLESDVSSLDNWFQIYPRISLTTSDTDSEKFTTYYNTKHENFPLESEEWYEYANPIYVNKDGITTIRYRALDENNNIENTNTHVIQVNTGNMLTDTATVKNTIFSTNPGS